MARGDAPNSRGWLLPGCTSAASPPVQQGRMATVPVPHAAGRHWDVSRVNYTYSLGLVPEAFVGSSRERRAAAGAVRVGRTGGD